MRSLKFSLLGIRNMHNACIATLCQRVITPISAILTPETGITICDLVTAPKKTLRDPETLEKFYSDFVT